MPDTTCTEPNTTNTMQNGTYRHMSVVWSGQLCRLLQHIFLSAAVANFPPTFCSCSSNAARAMLQCCGNSPQVRSRKLTRKYACTNGVDTRQPFPLLSSTINDETTQAVGNNCVRSWDLCDADQVTFVRHRCCYSEGACKCCMRKSAR